jgi:uncharacterized membrane protein
MDEPTPGKPQRKRSLFSPRRASGRFMMAIALGVAATLPFMSHPVAWWVRAVVGWDAASLALVAILWTIILRADPLETKRRAGQNDPGRMAVFTLALGSSLFSLFAAAFVLRKVRTLPAAEEATWTLLALAAVALSWVLTHTLYTLRYAHLYYRRKNPGGLVFPGDDPPCDIDFAYFAFTVGMCFQVSDVVVGCTRLRRAVLFHAVISFVYNTTILALALNLVFGSIS